MKDFAYEMIIPNAGFPFKMFMFEGKNGHYYRDKHWHRSIEIFAVFEGEMDFTLDEQLITLHSGEFVMVNSNEIHSISAPFSNLTIVLQLPLELFKDYYTADSFIRFSHDTRKQDRQMLELLRQMYQTYQEKPLGYELHVNGQFYELMYLLVTKYREAEADKEQVRISKKLGRLTAITAYMRENYQKDLSLEGLAEIFGYSPAYLSRMFQKYAKTNYKTYLENLRVEYAFRELSGTTKPIMEIALENGFPNSKAFARVFKERYHMLPSEYRNMHCL